MEFLTKGRRRRDSEPIAKEHSGAHDCCVENRGWLEFLVGQFFLSLICGIVLMVVVMAFEGLHFISNGKIPSLIVFLAKWEPGQKAPSMIHDDDESLPE